MSAAITQDIQRCLHDLDVIDERMATARFVFDEEFLGFQGHFENHPVLPGVCKIMAAVEVVKRWKQNDQLKLKEIRSAKFFLPVTCHDELAFHCLASEQPEGVEVVVKVEREKERISTLKLFFE